jgi:hypothetical protein
MDHARSKSVIAFWDQQWASVLGSALALAFLFALSGDSSTAAQQPNLNVRTQPSFTPDDPFDSHDPVMEAKRIRRYNIDRQKSMVADADKLLKLAKDLNAQIVGPHSGSITAEQFIEASEIEKLARNVKDKMSNSIVLSTAFH